jgi:hypothetical protein
MLCLLPTPPLLKLPTPLREGGGGLEVLEREREREADAPGGPMLGER